jgi:hypothetical protein
MLDAAVADIRREKDWLVALAADFAARAKTFTSPGLRELISLGSKRPPLTSTRACWIS